MARESVLLISDDVGVRDAVAAALVGTAQAISHISFDDDVQTALLRDDPTLLLWDDAGRGREQGAFLAAAEQLPVLFLTDARDSSASAIGMHQPERRPFDVVRKPIVATELRSRINILLRLARTTRALETSEKDAAVVLELTQALALNLDVRGILFTVVRRIAEVVNVDRASIVLSEGESGLGYVVAASDDATLQDLPVDLHKYPEIRHVLESHEPLVITDLARHPLLEFVVRLGGVSGFCSAAIIPIVYEKRATGVLFLRAKRPFQFGKHELSLCTTISNAMAVALRNATVLQSFKDQNRQVVKAQREAESRVHSLQRYADFIESAADGIVVLDSSGAVLFANAKAQTVSGYSAEEMSRRKLRELFVAEDAARVSALKAGFARGEFPQGVDLRIVRPDGLIVAISVNFNSVLREEGVVFSSFRDVTEERRIAAELVKTKDFLQRVIDSSADAIVSADLAGRIVLFNPAAERVYGYLAADIVGEDVTRLYPEGGARDVMKWVRSAGGRVEGIRTEILAASGQRIPVLLSAALIHQGDSPVGTVGIFTDLRDRMRMEQRLHEAQDQLLSQERQAIVAELAGAAAHELNQPLTSVMGYAELLKRRLDPSTPYFRAAEVIYSEADRMAEIVRKIGKITRYETKSYVGQARILDLDKASGGHSGNQGGAD